MPELSLTESIITSLNAQEPWPDNVKLFQPYEVEQILLPDNASCLAVQAFLKMCNLPFEVEMRWNAEFMSPSGRVPFIKCGAFVVSELEPVVQFAASKGVTLCGKLSTEEKAEMRAYMSLITNVLVNAELYISWLDDETFNAVTKVRNSSVYPWPLGWLQTRAKRNAVAKRLKALHWHDKTLDQVLADVEQCCNSLSQRLGDRDYFFGTPTPLDALVYGHIRAILSDTAPKAALMIKLITSSLLKHMLRMVNLTGMKLTYQEEYLISQAFKVHRRRSPERASARSARAKKSKMAVRASMEDVFGVKPFASKQIMFMTSKDGGVTCQSEKGDFPEKYDCYDIIDEILDKVEKMSDEKHDFEVIISPEKKIEKFVSVDVSNNDFLGTIDEVDTEANSSMIDTISEDAQMLTDVDSDVPQMNADVESDTPQVMTDIDSDGVVTDKLLSVDDVNVCFSPELIDYSDVNEKTENDLSTSGDPTQNSPTAKLETRSIDSAESKTTLKMPSGDLSLENILDYFKKTNPPNHEFTVADVDD